MRSVLLAPQLVRLAAFALIALAAPVTSSAQIRCGETLRRTVAPGERTDALTFTAQADEVVSIAVFGVPDPVVPRVSPTWELHDPSGQIVRTSRLAKHCRGQCETLPLGRSGTFTIRVSIPSPGVARDYNISLEALSQTADGLPNGPPDPICGHHPDGTRPLDPLTLVTGTIQEWGETDTFTFRGGAGEVVIIAVTPLAGSQGDTFSPRWELFDPQGQRVLTSLRARSCTRQCTTEPLPSDGTFTLRIADRGADALGGYTLLLVPPGATTSTSTSTTTSSTTTSTTSSTTTSTSTSLTSTTAPSTSTTTTSTLPATRLPVELGITIRRPAAGEGCGRAVAVRGGDLLLGAPHAAAGVVDTGAVYVIAIGGTPGSPGFGALGATLHRPGTPATGDAFGTAVAAVGTAVLVGAPGDDLGAADAGAAYLFAGAGNPVVLIPPVPEAGAAFGFAVAARGVDVVIGAPGASRAYLMNAGGSLLRTFEDPSGSRAGAQLGYSVAATDDVVVIGAPGAHVLSGAAFLFRGDAEGLALASEGAAGDDFGYAVAVLGGEVFVGAPGNAGDTGRVLVFDAASGALIRTLPSPSPTPGDRFGAALTVTDGAVLVGAPGAGGGSGAVYRFARDAESPGDTLRKPQPTPGDAFGTALVVVGDRPVVGAPGDDAGAVGGGAAYLFTGTTLDAVFRHRLLPDAFGTAVAASDGTIVVGAPFDAAGDGAAYTLAAGGAGPAATLASPVAAFTRFGHAVAVLGSEIVVGAPAEQSAAGAVHLYDGTTLRRTLTGPSPVAGDQFGFAVAAVDGDVLVGAPFTGASDAGAVYVLDAVTGTLRTTLQKPTPTAGDFFGAALAVDGTQVLVGAPFDGAVAPNAGAAYLLDRSTAALEQVYQSPAPAAGDLFGAAVALTGSRVVVGAPLANAAALSTGRVFVFDRTTGALGFLLENPTPDAGDQFGAAVTAVGDDIAVGAPLDDGGMIDTGTVYLFDGATGVLLETLPNPAQAPFDHFGATVAMGPPGLLIGAPGPSRVYVFVPGAGAVVRSGGIRARATAPGTRCGNGIVEEGEACDDGNAVDTDDCRTDCSGSYCCTFDPLAAARCDDGDPCTDDALDPLAGCRHTDNGTCCPERPTCAGDQTCSLCAGCFLYPWDCCARRQRCLPLSPECTGTTCFPAASCECAGGLTCTGGDVPSRILQRFARACDQLRLQATFSPQSVPSARRDLLLTRSSARTARRAIRQAARITRKLAGRGQVTRSCRAALLQKIATVKRAIPRGKRLRRCVAERRVE